MINVPIKQGIRVQIGYGTNRPLANIREFFQCQSQGFGERPDVYGMGGHNGIDLVYQDGTEVFSPIDGVMGQFTDSASNGGYGKFMRIVGGGYQIVLAHLKEFLVPAGPVKTGQLLAHGDSTGFSSGSHLHITLKLVDTNGTVLNRLNGHDGAVDPTPYLAMTMFELQRATGRNEVYLVRGLKKSRIGNAKLLTLISDFGSVKEVSPVALDSIPDTGEVLISYTDA